MTGGTAEPGIRPWSVPDLVAAASEASARELMASLVELGLPLTRILPRALGSGTELRSGLAWHWPQAGELLEDAPLIVGLGDASIADRLPAPVIGATRRTAGIMPPPLESDAHLLVAPLDAALVRCEVEGVLQLRSIESPQASPAMVDLLLAAFGFPVDPAEPELFTTAERALALRLMPFLTDWLGTVRGAALVLHAIWNVPIQVEDRQPRRRAVPQHLRARLGRAALGTETWIGTEVCEAHGYRVTIGPVPTAVAVDLGSPHRRRQLQRIMQWLLPVGGAVVVKTMVAAEDRGFVLGKRQPRAVLGLTTWTALRHPARNRQPASP